MINEYQKRSGYITVDLTDEETGIVTRIWEGYNLIVDSGRNLQRDCARGAVADTKIRYCALGTDSTTASVSQRTLVTEVYRNAITAYGAGGTGVMTSTAVFSTTQANGYTLREVGWFASPSAKSAANSGVMIARVVPGSPFPLSKTSAQTLTIVRTDTFS